MGYPGLSLVMFLENVFPPIPSEIVLPLAGTLTVSSDPEIAPQFNIVSVILWATLGSFLGAWIWYWVGYLISEDRVRKLLQKIGKFIMITEKDLDTALDWFGKYGEWCVFFGRMVPIIRTLISVPAGLAKMQGQYGSNYPTMMASAVLALVPMIVIYVIFQKQFVEGIATSGGKL